MEPPTLLSNWNAGCKNSQQWCRVSSSFTSVGCLLMPPGSISWRSGSVSCSASCSSPITLSMSRTWNKPLLTFSCITTSRPSRSNGPTQLSNLKTNSESIYGSLYLDPQNDLSFQDFMGKKEYTNAKLYRETKESLSSIRQLKKLDKKKIFHAKSYDTAPYCFMLMADDSVLIEQYHYGNIDINVDDGKLGNDIARFEYAKEVSDLYEV